jgi:hypothetical protein
VSGDLFGLLRIATFFDDTVGFAYAMKLCRLLSNHCARLQSVENLSQIKIVQFDPKFSHISTDTPGQVQQKSQAKTSVLHFFKRFGHSFKMELTSRTVGRTTSRAWYEASFREFLGASLETVIAKLTANNEFDLVLAQRDAWRVQIEILQSCLAGLDGHLFLEFNIPRMGRRIDAVFLINQLVFVIEFKIGERAFDQAAYEQVWDYALDLKNFHEASHAASIVPILLATEAKAPAKTDFHLSDDKVCCPMLVNTTMLRPLLEAALTSVNGIAVDAQLWSSAPYHPTPTIVEAARSLYAQHSVEAIARYDAGTKNLRVTSARIEQLVDEARGSGKKIICFVTGVPGAGKTLVGLNVATRRRNPDEPTHAVFLSGNGPLVAVLHEALTRDEVLRRKTRGEKVRKKKVAESVKAFIQNVHHFRDDSLIDSGPPIEHVVIFDEAQRAWNLRQTANFMKRKKNRADFGQSEPECLISYMDRHNDWAVIVCLVGGGQEINIGEAGIDAWLDAISKSFPKWHMYISERLTDSEYAAGKALEHARKSPLAHFDDALHLSVPRRSFRAEHVSTFVKALLDCDKLGARKAFASIADRYPVAITRNLHVAKQWVRSQARGSERFGLMASSKALRLKPHAIDIRIDVNPVHWFLSDRTDTRSSYYLEDAATEFQVQGLELDWACVTWDGDLRFTDGGWSFHEFRGNAWCNINNVDNRKYLRNAYRVLLTRARQGMVIFVPEGTPDDPTRSPGYYDSTFTYLAELGIPVISTTS